MAFLLIRISASYISSVAIAADGAGVQQKGLASGKS